MREEASLMSSFHDDVERTQRRERGRWSRTDAGGDSIYKNTYQTWRNGKTMRLEDDILLAACSTSFSMHKGRQPQSSKLLGLPTELQIAILRKVDRSDFKVLSQTSVALRAAVTPLILEHVILSGDSPRLLLVIDTLLATCSKSKDVANMIRHMKLPDDDTLSDILIRLLPFTTKLRSLEYGYIVHEGPRKNDVVNAHALSSLLAPVRHTLTSLKINYILDVNENDAGGEPCVEGWLCAKKMFALKKLETTFTIIFGPSKRAEIFWHDPCEEHVPALAEVLPPGLEELRILSDPWEYDPAGWNTEQRVEKVASYVRGKRWEEFTPKLRLLNYDMDISRYWRSSPSKVAAEEKLAEIICENGLEWALEIPSAPPVTNLFYMDDYREAGVSDL